MLNNANKKKKTKLNNEHVLEPKSNSFTIQRNNKHNTKNTLIKN